MQDDATRIVEDALGTLTVPRDAYYGAQTERGRRNNDVSGQVIGDFPGYVNAIVEVKKACALANRDIGVLRKPVADAICQAADEVLAGRFGRSQFPIDIMNAGGGVSPNMNVNELVANRANEILTGSKGYELVHPNNHVNTGQSTSDVLETAMSIALHRDILGLLASVRRRHRARRRRGLRRAHLPAPARGDRPRAAPPPQLLRRVSERRRLPAHLDDVQGHRDEPRQDEQGPAPARERAAHGHERDPAARRSRRLVVSARQGQPQQCRSSWSRSAIRSAATTRS
jgi:hypothetical protein